MVARQARIVVLSENTVRRRGLLAEHGLALWVETERHRVLFDTGQGMVLEHNARQLGTDLALADAIVLSHGHYDHAGGAMAALAHARRCRLFAHPCALRPKFARPRSAPPRSVCVPELAEENLRQRGCSLHLAASPTVVTEGMTTTGEIPRHTDYEDTGGPFYLDAGCSRPDPLLDDQAMFLDTPQGVVVIAGCAHAGIVNTLSYIVHLAGPKPILCVIGGIHLEGASALRLRETVEAFRRYGVQRIGLGHCTGTQATMEFWTAFPGRCFPIPVGTEILLGEEGMRLG